ncbi:helix-turn-helix domain-containing protein [Actinacidiphila sp. ITFR-21]|uniref:helix-turn-helix domain-containing protein n=1 Tax=Actinacidiphila sp. ITFR-21 TaxID=3075199 RepID=UPI00288C56AD|nr:helix-turn-helix transcriptional regulator [Streptomyces sp. ITFR-21]WNI14727.1 helix-turn-helix transcriptional regulator [Streptomyces sp. ITFR-21]
MASDDRTDGSGAPDTPVAGPPPDLAGRVARYCGQLGITASELADRAAMAPAYLRHLEELGYGFDEDGLRRLAGALHVTYDELLAGRADEPPDRRRRCPAPGWRS